MTPKRGASVALALLVAAFLSACGGGGGESGSSTASTATATTSQGGTGSAAAAGSGPEASGQGGGSSEPKHAGGDTSAHFTPKPHHDSGGGAAQFESKGGDNSIQEYGSEAGSSEFEAAAAALHGYLDARAAGAWSAACSYMAPGVSASLGQLAGGETGEAACPEILASLSAGIPPAALREAAVANAGALRIEGGSALLLFRGSQGVNYFMPMSSAGGGWKIAAIAPSAVP